MVLLYVFAADGEESHVRMNAAHCRRGGEQLPVSLVRDQPSEGPDDDGVRWDPELGAQRSEAVLPDPARIEQREVDSVSDESARSLVDDPNAPCITKVFLALV